MPDRTFSVLISAVALAAAAAAQDGVLYYKFDAADATQVVNYATGPHAAPRFGTTMWSAEQSYTTGRSGSALQRSGFVGLAGKFVDTGFGGPLAGSLTIAFALRNGGANTPTQYSPIAGQPSWSIATGGSAGAGLQLHGVGVGDLNGVFGLPLCSMPGWNHFAVVVDATAGTASWYHDGALVSSQPIAGAVQIQAQQQLRVGTDYVTHCGGLYDIDEFRLLDRAASALEIAQWASQTTAAAVRFGADTAVDLQAEGAPSLGNSAFALQATAPAGTLVAFAQGFSYTRFAARTLPVDLGQLLPIGAGQTLRVAPEQIDFAVAADGVARLPLGVPQAPQLLGLTLAVQAAVLPTDGALTVSNGLLLSAGSAP